MSSMVENEKLKEKLKLARRIKALMFEVSHLAAESGVRITPYLSPDDFLPYERFNESELVRIELGAQEYYQTLSESLMASTQKGDGKQIFWSILRRMDLVPTSDFFSFVSNEYIFEIYDASFKQIFRNLNFFSITSYSLEELCLNEWVELFERNAFLDRKIGIEAVKIFDGTYDQTTPISIGKHLLNERFSAQKLLLAGEFHYFSPLFDKQGHVVACAVLSKVEILGSLVDKPTLISEFNLNAERISQNDAALSLS